MLDSDSWIKLLTGLTQSTLRGSLEWERSNGTATDPNIGTAMVRMLSNTLNQPKIYKAVAGGASYELASADGYGNAPYELRVWDFKGARLRPIGSVKSSVKVTEANYLKVNSCLETLFKAVDDSTESSGEIVDRLLRGLE